MKFPRLLVGLVFLPLALGCGEATSETVAEANDSAPAPAATAFSAETAGTIRGRVAWEGPIPQPPPYRVTPAPLDRSLTPDQPRFPNPNAPVIDPQNRGVGNAVVFLRGIDPARGRPWDHKPVVVELNNYRILLGRSSYGFVRQGDAVQMVSRQPAFQSLHADGASFFSLAFPDPEQPLTRRLRERGVVELTSGSGYFWMRGYLFVDDHPYYAPTARDGSFVLPQVPPGDYELVCWLPNWNEDRRNRDPETGLVTRIFYRPPVETVQKIHVGTREDCNAQFRISTTAFDR